jgi:hypothetical protein
MNIGMMGHAAWMLLVLLVCCAAAIEPNNTKAAKTETVFISDASAAILHRDS